jgi:hypothetical protein
VIVILDRQHYGKPHRDDKGAQIKHGGEYVYEVDLTLSYIEHATALLTSEGHTVHVLDSGWYGERHERAAEIARDNPDELVAYVACHVNAGLGNYGLLVHDARSRAGLALAESVASVYGAATTPQIARVLVRASERGGTWGRAHTTIAGIWDAPANCAGVCFEPYFIDQPDHAPFLSAPGLEIIGHALAVGCMQWAGQ